jgi:hypothetical protein
MQAYQVKVLPRNTNLYGGRGVAAGNDADGPVLIIKNDRFGEQVKLTVVSQKPTQTPTTTDVGVLERDEAFTLSLKFVLRVEAKTLAPNFDSFVSCTIMQGQL